MYFKRWNTNQVQYLGQMGGKEGGKEGMHYKDLL